jgi:predicted nucleic acid-binding protein
MCPHSWQVLHEFYANAHRKIGVSETLARTAVETLAAWGPAEVTLGLLQQSWKWMDSAQISYWDSLILSAAERSGCRWLLSEDFQTGRKFEQVAIVNPFLSTPTDFGLASQVEGR